MKKILQTSQKDTDSFEHRFQTHLKEYNNITARLDKFSTSKTKGKKNQASKVSNLIKVQALRILELSTHLKEKPVAILADPVGSGKTVVALSALQVLFENKIITRAVVVAPNRTVAQKWEEEALALGFGARDPETESTCQLAIPNKKYFPNNEIKAGLTFEWQAEFPEQKLVIVTRAGLPEAKAKSINNKTVFVIDEAHRGLHKSINSSYKNLRNDRTLFVIDEAHRGLHKSTNSSYENLSAVSQGAKMLLVTATPMQLSATGLITMLSVASEDTENDKKWKPLEQLGKEVRAAFEVARKDYERLGPNANEPLSDQAKKKANDARNALAAAKYSFQECFLLPIYPRIEAGIPDLPEVKRTTVPLIHEEKNTKQEPNSWATAYQVARIIPELIGSKHGDMFRRRLVSSTDAFINGETGKKFLELIGNSEEIKALYYKLEEQLKIHPKIGRTIEWINQQRDRHILVFCVFKDTQNELKKRLINFTTEKEVLAPDDATKLTDEFKTAFRTKVSGENPRRILLVRDNLSESIDLDGGSPCIVHYDLAWNPVRLIQRYGRVVRASSGFEPIKPEDIFLPYLDVEVDRRMAETIHGRAGMAGLLLPTESQDKDPEELAKGEGDSDDHAWAVPVELLKIIYQK